ncbi:MAG: RidA family protein, partial [Candidatus Binatia bacterium]|nr:RidA family protein [Candidatus Binatia bacterium]
MSPVIHSERLFSEKTLFSQGRLEEKLTFLAQDARAADGSLREVENVEAQTRRTLENLVSVLGAAGQGLEDVVSLTVYLTDYGALRAVAKALDAAFPPSKECYPATTFLGVMALEGGCRVRMDAVVASNSDREQVHCPGVPYALGVRCHGARAGDFLFLSGVDAADAQGELSRPADIESQTLEVLNRIDAILKSQGLSLKDVFRTFMFMFDSRIRPRYGKARRERYAGIFREDEPPPNSGIMMKDLGRDILLRSVAFAYRGKDRRLISSPKVRRSPGSFSQAVRVGDWLFVAGQDAIGLNREVQAAGDVARQTEITLGYLMNILDVAGGTMRDVVKTTVYLVAGQDRLRFVGSYQEFFKTYADPSALPSGLTMEVKELAYLILVEIDAVAL